MGMAGDPATLALISPGYAVMMQGDRLIAWDLSGDRRVSLARVWDATIWPRDLRKSGRFVCRVSGGKAIDAYGRAKD